MKSHFHAKVISAPRSVPCQGQFHAMVNSKQGHFRAKVISTPSLDHLLLAMSVPSQDQFHAKVS
jgi:hypothetical protein